MENYLFSNFEKVQVSANPDLAAEQKYLAHAYDRLEAMRKAAQEMMESALSTPRGGTHQARAERDVIVRRSLNRLEQLEIGDQALSFGGIDQDKSLGQVATFHIGRLAIADDDMEPLVVDWRAPVAEPFYRATGKEPMGLSRRRHFAVEHRQVVTLEDELFDADKFASELEGSSEDTPLAGPGSLFAAVNRARTGRMTDIVATIQSQQDEIIRAPLSELLVVQGGPGTGKTAVALHRAAYLLYTYRMRLERQGVLVVAPNRIFARYIDNVLPSLGETGVEIMTIDGVAGFGEATIKESPDHARLKGDLRMVDFIAKAVRDRQRPLKNTEDIAIGAFVISLTHQDTQEAVRIARRRSGTHNQRRRFVESFLAVKIAEKYISKRELRLKDDLEVSDLFDDNLISISSDNSQDENSVKKELARKVQKSFEFAKVVQRVWPKLSPETFIGDLFSHMPLIRLAGSEILTDGEMKLLFRHKGDAGSSKEWSRSDLVLLNEARTLLGSYQKKTSEQEERGFGHIIIDEAQDLSPMAARMVGRYSLNSSMTIVGDVAQATSPFGQRSWEQIVSPLPRARSTTLVELKVNYRTPQEVMDVASGLLASFAPQLKPATSIRFSGEPVVLHRINKERFSDEFVSVVKNELETIEPGTVAVIAPAEATGELVAILEDAGLPASKNLGAAISVLSIEDAKGLEFDSVVISQAGTLQQSGLANLQALFVAMTRTTKRLVILDGNDVPDVVVDLVLRQKK